jgi:protein-L-isoaspartate(D-aspartate) O-methyltransferase
MADPLDSPGQVAARARMVANQLERRGIGDRRVLDVMRRVPRHLFVPAHLQASAYDDRALEIGEGQTISQPFMVATMTEAIALREEARVLEIGTGSGYQAAVLAEIAREVVTIERRPELAARARRTIDSLGYRNVRVLVGDGTLGFAELAPYDAIAVTAAAPKVPPSLKLQLAEGGRLVVPVGPRFNQELLLINRRGAVFTESRRELCVFVPLIGEQGWPDS